MSKHVSIMNHDVVDGTPKIQVDRRTQIKLAQKPQIVIAIPCGDKHQASVLKCPSDHGGCGKVWMLPEQRQPNLIPVHLMLAHMNMIQPLNCATTYMVESGRLSAEARQIMTKSALKQGAKYILYWDDDTIPPPLGLAILHNWMERHPEAGAISGVYTTREPTMREPLIYQGHGEGASWDFPIGPGAEPQKIFGAGAGFLLARLEAVENVIEHMKAENDGKEIPIWADERTVSISDEGDSIDREASRPSMWGHDVRFCKLLNEHGWPVYVHGEVLCGHLDIPTGVLHQMPDDAPGWTTPRSGQGTYPTKVAAIPTGDPRVLDFIINNVDKSEPLDYAEIGVYEGETAKRVADLLGPGSRVHLFDFQDKVSPAADKIMELDKDVAVVEWGNTRNVYDSYNWELQRAIDMGVQLDVAFLDGAHTFHHDALAFFLLDKMIKPGGYILFDDYEWSHSTSPSMNPAAFPQIKDQYTDEQIQTQQVKMLVDKLVKTDPRYEEVIPGFAYRKKE